LFCLILSPAASAADRYLGAGDSLQEALNAAAPGDTITLAAGTTFTGNFVLQNRTGSGWITIQSSMMASLPAAGQRVSPSHAPYMAKIVSPNGSAAINAAPGAHNYRIMGLEITAAPGVYSRGFVTLGEGNETRLDQLPYAIVLDRLYIHGDPEVGAKRGVALNSRDSNVTNSYISDIKSTSQDSQAIGGYNGPGPFQVINNYLEASGENIMFGGAAVTIPNLVPSDIVIRGNHLFKPLSWRKGSPTYDGTAWVVKNLFELKNARRVVVEGNIMENNWTQAQAGVAIQLTVKTEGGAMPWAVVEDVMFTSNIVRHAGAGINILGRDNGLGVVRRITFRNNIFDDIDKDNWVGGGHFIALLDRCEQVIVDHNTILQSNRAVSFDTAPSPAFVYTNNISPKGTYGIHGSGQAEGIGTLRYYAPGAVVTNNVIAGASPSVYPPENFMPASLSDVRFIDLLASNFKLAPDSPYLHSGTDGSALGADYDAVMRATGLRSISTCIEQNPTLNVQPASVPMSGTSVDLSVTIRNNDTAACLGRTLKLSAQHPSGWSGSFSSSSVALKPGESRSVTLTESVPSSSPYGTYSVNVTAADSVSWVTTLVKVTVGSKTAPVLSQVTVAPGSITYPGTGTGTVTLSSAAPAGGMVVKLSGSNAAAIIPASVTVPEGAATATFKVSTAAVSSNTSVTITAAISSITKTAAVTIIPPQSNSALDLLRIRSQYLPVMGGAKVGISIDLTYKAPPGGGAIQFTSSDPSLMAVPASVSVPGGNWGASIWPVTRSITSPQTVRITATSGKSVRSIDIPMFPVLVRAIHPPGTMSGGSSANMKMDLWAGAPAGGVNLSLSSSCSALTVPASLFVAEGVTYPAVTFQTKTVSSSTQCMITVRGPHNQLSAYVLVQP
jgi:hypothetical protein